MPEEETYLLKMTKREVKLFVDLIEDVFDGRTEEVHEWLKDLLEDWPKELTILDPPSHM